MVFPELLTHAGFTPEALARVDRLMVGAGGFVRELLTYTGLESETKGDSGERLSAADTAVDLLLREQVQALFPGSAGYSEEGGAFGVRTGGLQVRWSLDPLDGTRPALLGGAYAVCAGALVVNNDHPVAALGWVYLPNLSTLYRGIVAPGYTECLLNGRPVHAPEIPPDRHGHHYLAVGSDWTKAALPRNPFKLSAPGATSIHLTQLVHPASDTAAVIISRYRSYDAAAALPIVAAGGCEIRPVGGNAKISSEPVPVLWFLAELDRTPTEPGPRALVARPDIVQVFMN